MSEFEKGRSAGLEEALAAMIEVAKKDYAQGSGVQNIVCAVLHSAMTRIISLRRKP